MGGHYGRCRAHQEAKLGIAPPKSAASPAGSLSRRQFAMEMLNNPAVRAGRRIFEWKPNLNATRVPPAKITTELPCSQLVPIRLNITCEGASMAECKQVADVCCSGRQLKDALLWDISEQQITPEDFGRLLCYDLELPMAFESLVAQSIHEQLANYCMQHLKMNHEHRTTIKLDLRLGGYCLRDQFEWDLTEPSNDPELFARSLCAELGLSQVWTASRCAI